MLSCLFVVFVFVGWSGKKPPSPSSAEDGVLEPRPEGLVVPDEGQAPEAVDARGVVAVVDGDARALQLLHEAHAVLLQRAVLCWAAQCKRDHGTV